MNVHRVGFDRETHLIGPQAVFPKPVCATTAWWDGSKIQTAIVSNGDGDAWEGTHKGLLDWLESDDRNQAVLQNGHGFDLPDIIIWQPWHTSQIFRLLAKGVPTHISDRLVGHFRDTLLREKLLNLALSGVVDYYFTPDGKAHNISYKLASLVAKYLGQDRTQTKGQDAEGNQVATDIWRLNFRMLDGIPSKDYPPEADHYAREDASDCLLVSYGQDGRANAEFTQKGAIGHDGKPFDVFRTEPLHVAAMVCLSLATHEGFGIIPEEVASFEAAVEKARRPENVHLLFESELFSRPEPVRPYAKNAKHGPPGEKPCTCAAETHEPGTPKMKHAEPHHRSNKKLLELVVKAWAANRLCDEEKCPRFGAECGEHGLPPLRRNDPSPTEIEKAKAEGRPPVGSISCDGEAIADLASFCPILEQYDRWTVVDKMVTGEIPRLQQALREGQVIHGGFNDFKKTSRASSSRSKLYASINIQQVPRGFKVHEHDSNGKPIFEHDAAGNVILDGKGKPKPLYFKIEPRHAYRARREGWVLVSIDYSFIELVTLAQTTKRVIGYSVLGEKIAQGFDPHAFLGAQLAAGLDQDFADACRATGNSAADDIYRFFERLKAGTSEQKEFYKYWRTLAKSVGLGYPGGLGARTFIIYAKKLYGITVKSIEQAKQFREVWLSAFPENREYLNRYIRDNLRDDQHSDSERERFAYFCPLGGYRARCSFTEAANGLALQTPAAIGMKTALFNVQRACWDPAMNSGLYGCRTVAAIHDELLIAMPNDQYLHERAFEASRLWIEGMRVICPDIPLKADPAAMTRWDKGAEMVLGPDERLRVWNPLEKYKLDSKLRLRSAT